MTPIMNSVSKFLSLLFASTFAVFSSAIPSSAQVSVRADLDSMAIFVGGQVGLNVTVEMNKDEQVHVIPLPDSLSEHVEVVEALKPDTITKGDLLLISCRYLVTSFDTGLQYVGPIPTVVVADSVVARTPDFALNVINPFQGIAPDTVGGVIRIFDVFGAENAPFLLSELLQYWPWLVAAILVAALVFGILYLRKKYSAKTVNQAVSVPDEPCEVTARRDLERIRAEKIWQSNRTKEFYSDVTDTLRRYVSARFSINAMESTSSEIMDLLRSHLRDDKQDAALLEQILEQADFAKFAKMEPAPDENELAIANALKFVDSTTERALSEASSEPINTDKNV